MTSNLTGLGLIAAVVSLVGCGRANTAGDSSSGLESTGAGACLSQLISGSQPDEMSPEKISQFTYDGRLVYFVTARCCDAYNQAFDSTTCQLICAPSGGISGAGDGRCSTFSSAATNERLVWERGASGSVDAGTPGEP